MFTKYEHGKLLPTEGHLHVQGLQKLQEKSVWKMPCENTRT